jgi:hypothetical protein
MQVYRFRRSRTPAAKANKAMIIPIPGIEIDSNCSRPVKISHILNNNIPRFLKPFKFLAIIFTSL